MKCGLRWAAGLLLSAGTPGLRAASNYLTELWDFDPNMVKGAREGPARDDIVPGEFIVDPPTLENLGFRWMVEGDRNRNATVEVSYRRKGEPTWRPAQPMLRVRHEVTSRFRLRDERIGNPGELRFPNRYYRTGNLFAGSVMFLDPGTEYDVKFAMRDPDGGTPIAPRIVTVATRPEPVAGKTGRTLHVYPADWKSDRVKQDAFDNIPAAYETARPGDVILLHAGIHHARGAPYLFTKSGGPGRPIVFRGAGAGKTIIQGSGLQTDLFRLAGADHLMFEDLTLHGADTAIGAGSKGDPGASWLTVRRCHIEDVVTGISTLSENSRNWYIADNVITGIKQTFHPRPASGYMDGSHTGVSVYGQGHAVCYNRISRFSDSLTIGNFGHPLADIHRHAVNIDFYNNELSFAMDDTIEADYGSHNIRIYRNLLYNAHTALSVQPAYGGPVYLMRNVAYGITLLSFKWNAQPAGPIAYHNTVISGGNGINSPLWSNGHLRNNLILGNRDMILTGTFTPETSTLDFNGYHGAAIQWTHGRDKRRTYNSLTEFSAATGYEKNGVQVDFGVFVRAAPVKTGTTYTPDNFDLRLAPGSKPVDAGIRLPNINDDFAGTAPDLGAYELGQPRPYYGPRP